MGAVEIRYTTKFKKDYKRLKRQGVDLSRLGDVLRLIANGEPLSAAMRDHQLSGEYRGHRECHIAPDWLLIYLVDHEALVLTAVRTGSHVELLDC